MQIARMTCRTCFGTGLTKRWRVSEEEPGIAHAEETTCNCCGGKGYIEYPIFTVEEAEAILKHCGLEVPLDD